MNDELDRPPSSGSQDDWDAHWSTLGEVAHEMNPALRFRERIILDRLGPVAAGSTVLDIGCGQGDFLLLVKHLYPQGSVCGIDVSPEGIEHARRLAATAGIDASFVVCDLLRPIEHGSGDEAALKADKAVCSEVLEHVDDPVTLLRNAAEFLKAGATLVVTVPGGPRTAFDRHIGHRRHFTRRRLTAVLTAAGFVPLEVDAVGFPVFNLYKLLVLLRGKRVISDATRNEGAASGRLSGMVLRAFAIAFEHSPTLRRGGWQNVAVARLP